MNSKRLIVYLFLNALVSAAVTLSVLWGWDKTHPLPTLAPCAQATAAPSVVSLTSSTATALASGPALATVTPGAYVVQSGDTLGGIAERYNLTVEQLMAANNLTDPNLLRVGQSLVIPGNGYAPTPLATGTPGALPTNAAEPPRATATSNPNAPLPHLTIREVRAPGKLADETVVIANQGGPVDLADWTLRDEAGHLYRFPALTLFEGGAVSLHTGAGSDTVTDLYWKLGEPVWASGKQALLSDAGGNLQTRFTVP
jgi:LysM repeat protein